MDVSANAFLVANLLAEVCDLDPWPTREDWKLTRDLAMRSLLCVGAKVWIAEKVDDQDVREFILDSPRLVVPEWLPQLSYRDERACGPLPPADLCWLELKGCFLEGETIYSRKDPFDRACDIYEMGYT